MASEAFCWSSASSTMSESSTETSFGMYTSFTVRKKAASWERSTKLLTEYRKLLSFSKNHTTFEHPLGICQDQFMPGALWLLRRTMAENSTNKFSFQQSLWNFNPFFARVTDSLLYISGNNPGCIWAPCSPCFPYTNNWWLPLVSLSESHRWSVYCIR